MLGAQTVVRRAPEVLCERVGEGFVLLDPAHDRYVRLNATGGWLFEALEQPQPLADLAERLVRERGAPADRALEDAARFVGDLVRRGVVQVV